MHSELLKQTINAGFKHLFGRCYQLFNRLRIDYRGQKKVEIPWLILVEVGRVAVRRIIK